MLAIGESVIFFIFSKYRELSFVLFTFRAVVRQRPRSPSPLRTRGQRRRDGKEVVELRKLVIWQESMDNDDYCGVCMLGN